MWPDVARTGSREDAIRRVVILNWKDRSHAESGGAETYCENIAVELVRAGLAVTIVSAGGDGLAAREHRDGFAVRRLGRMLSVYPLALLWLLRHRREIDAVLDSQNGFPFFSPLVLPRTTPVALLIHHVHQDQFGMYYPEPVAAFGRFLESTMTRLVYGRRAVCVVSPSTRSEVRRRLQLRGPVFVTPNGVEPPSAHVTRSESPTIACVGRLTTHKRWELLLEALPDVLHAVPRLVVDIVGTGPDQDALVRRADELGVSGHVRFHGWVTTEERDEILGRAWLTVSTSVGEGWGLSIVEAAALGVPAVAFDVPGLRDSVRDEITGWLSTEDALASTIVRAVSMLSDDAAADEIAHACETWASSLRWSATADRIRAIFVSEAARDRRAAPGPVSADMACLVVLHRDAARKVDAARLGLLDQINWCPACVDVTERHVLMLAGQDENSAADFLEGLGVDVSLDALECRIARPSDLVQWQAGGRPHAHPSLDGPQPCPIVADDTDVLHRVTAHPPSVSRSA